MSRTCPERENISAVQEKIQRGRQEKINPKPKSSRKKNVIQKYERSISKSTLRLMPLAVSLTGFSL